MFKTNKSPNKTSNAYSLLVRTSGFSHARGRIHRLITAGSRFFLAKCIGMFLVSIIGSGVGELLRFKMACCWKNPTVKENVTEDLFETYFFF